MKTRIMLWKNRYHEDSTLCELFDAVDVNDWDTDKVERHLSRFVQQAMIDASFTVEVRRFPIE